MRKKVAARAEVGKARVSDLATALGTFVQRSANSAQFLKAEAYRDRVRGLRAVLDMHEKLLDVESASSRRIARKMIDDLAAVVDGFRAPHRLRIQFLEALDFHTTMAPQAEAEDVPAFCRLLDPGLSPVDTEDAATALTVWRTATRERKWVFLSELFARLGLGEVKPGSLHRDWQKWCAENVPLSEWFESGDLIGAIRRREAKKKSP